HGGNHLAQAVRQAYIAGQTDYSVEPLVLSTQDGSPIGRIRDGDSVIFCLRRGEREIQLTEAFVDPQAGGFPREKFTHLPFVILTLYHEKFKDLPVAFAPSRIPTTLSEVLSSFQRRQLHISESEKFAHVTFFLNGGNNQPFDGETDIRIPSPRGIPPEQVPELSLAQVANSVIDGISKGYEFIVTNFANGDVIGHTQNREAKLKCAEYIDAHLGRVVEAARSAGYVVVVTADHGNLEEMFNADGTPHVSHTTNPVPLILIQPGSHPDLTLHSGTLADVAPTILSIMGLPQSDIMTGQNLLDNPPGEPRQRVLLVILDGWGIGKQDASNPIYLARTPYWDSLLDGYLHTRLEASGEAVGLQAGKNGNSEAGHMNLGAGRLVWQDDVRLDHALQDGSFFINEIFLQTIADVTERRASLHLISLLSEKSSHGSIDYPLALLRMAKDHRLSDVFIHVIFDGRSTLPGSAPDLLAKLERKIAEIGIGQIVTGIGRGIALDRDGNYQKTRVAYDALVYGLGTRYYSS
ncbi:MAG TPA: sulfatase-like hydrolase/transferase, partial [Anaerolineales bacterium]